MKKKVVFYIVGCFILIAANVDVDTKAIVKSEVRLPENVQKNILLHKSGVTYVDDKQCAMCHGEIANSFQEVGMAKSFYRPGEQSFIEDFDNAIYYHQGSNRTFEMVRVEDELTFKRYQIDEQGDTINYFERRIDWIMGSGHKSRIYIFQTENGELFQLPLAWYTDPPGWEMAPGLQSRNDVILNRQVLRKCMFCHNAYPIVDESTQQYNWETDEFAHDLPSGIGCQRCHGPGGEHIDNVIATNNDIEKIKRAIVNPSKLPMKLRDDVCNQCHLQPAIAMMGVRMFDVSDYSFRPGEPLSNYIVHFDIEEIDMPKEERFEINHHAYRLYQSQCFIKSDGAMSCVTCHDPHKKLKKEEKIEHFKTVCTSCHQPHERKKSLAKFETIKMNDCTSCHMPQHRTQDVIHVSVTDHLIRKTLTEKDLLAPKKEKEHIITELEFLDNENIPEGPLGGAYKAVAAIRSYVTPEAVNYLSKHLFAADSDEVTPYYYLAKGQLRLGRLDDVWSTTDKILDRQPDSKLAFLWRGIVKLKTNNKEEALLYFKRVLKLDPEYFNANYNMGLALVLLKRYDEALKYFEKTIDLRNEFASAHYYLGNCYMKMNHYSEAIAAFKSALSIDPAHLKSYILIGEAYMKQKNEADALKFWNHGFKESNQNVELIEIAKKYGLHLASIE